MKNKIPIDLMVFDFDGTLTDSIPAAVEAIQAMLSELHLPPKSQKEIFDHIGFGEAALVAGSIGTEEPELFGRARAIYYDNVKSRLGRIPLFPHVRAILEFYRDKIKAVISNKRDEFIQLILDNHKLTPYFTAIIGGDSAPCLKPEPCAIIDLLKKHNVPKERAIIIGDMSVDVETGKNAGIHTCAVTYGFDPKEKLQRSRPDLLIADLLELKELIA